MLTIGVGGGTGSGKTTVVNEILSHLPSQEIMVISHDHYYHDNADLSFEDRAKINFDHPRSIDFDLLISHIKALKAGKTIERPVYCFIAHTRTSEHLALKPRKVIIVEGILALTHSRLRALFDMKIYIHADADERLIRRIKRDILERGRDLEEVLSRYQETLKPMHEQFIEPSKSYADIIIPNMYHNEAAINLVKSAIQNRIRK
ncbi:uridine kinase [Bacteroidetes bacterium endosymbiont of Geopemphigus sp.]|uniref:uridine kinase n=1 Tax=Bacteroidetes bacterium endosymbiont of Geopemphigus sp. TaxID=2047937 RepID=UPI000CD17FD5|nr:uridine kinase [Bacteroidetes bacterium endosymbiont of Geopemphigus sp.]